MAGPIPRLPGAVTLTITTGGHLTTQAIDLRFFAGGTIVMPAAWTAASIGFVHAYQSDDVPILDTPWQIHTAGYLPNFVAPYTPHPMYDGATLVEITGVAAGRDYPMPEQLFGNHFVWLWSQTAGVDVAQAAERSIGITLKS